MTALARSSTGILGPDGRPYGHGNGGSDNGSFAAEAVRTAEAIVKAFAAYPVAMRNIAAASVKRASEPFNNNPWVFACTMVIASSMAQSPYKMYEEEDETQEARRKVLAKKGLWSGSFPSGLRRRAYSRYCQQRCRRWGMVPRGLVEDETHQLSGLFLKPNSLMSGRQLWFVTNVHMALRGESFWLLLDENDKPTTWWQNNVASVWPVAPQLVTEIVEVNALVGWRISLPRGTDARGASGQRDPKNPFNDPSWRGSNAWTFTVLPDEIVHFYDPDPDNPLRGISPIAAAAADIYLDAATTRSNINLVNQGGVPPAVLVHKGPQKPFKNKKEEEEFRTQWMQDHPNDADAETGVGLLTGGWDYVKTGLSPKDMEFVEQKKWGRDEICAVMNVPKSMLSITDKINYATDLSQKRSFYETNILPRQEGIESTMDSTLAYAQPDTCVGMFDNSRVEALKVGVAEKLNAMNTACGATIHMPPREAAELVGLDLPAYDGDDICALPAGLVTFDAVLDGSGSGSSVPPAGPPGLSGPPSKPPGIPSKPQDAERTPLGEKPAVGETLLREKNGVDKHLASSYNARRGAKVHISKRARTTWSEIIRKVQAPYENRFRRAWRKFVARTKEKQLREFDQITRELGSIFAVVKAGAVDPDEVLLDLGDLQDDLSELFDPIYADELDDVVKFTVDEVGGISQLTPDDEDIQAALDRRKQILLDSAPETMMDSVSQAVQDGIDAGETVQEIRLRVAEQMDVSAGTGKTLTVARTESSGLMNEVREAVFDKAGFDKREWVTAGDEHVRPDHRTFGEAGPQDAGFNYLELVDADDEGTLEYPGDPRAPASQVINCRCVQVPA